MLVFCYYTGTQSHDLGGAALETSKPNLVLDHTVPGSQQTPMTCTVMWTNLMVSQV